jgi:small GTP-binding protein
MSYEIDKKVKIVLVGDTNVGKTTLFNKLRCEDYVKESPTIGVDFTVLRKNINNEKIKINIWDTAGQERFKSIVRSYFREISGAILIFDLSEYSSYINIQNWLNLINQENTCDHNHPVLLIGNKSDKRQIINNKDIEKIIQSELVIYKEVSIINESYDSLEGLVTKLIEKILLNANTCNGITSFNDDKKSFILNEKIIEISKTKCCK